MTGPEDPRSIVRRGYDIVSQAYRGDSFDYAGSAYEHVLERAFSGVPAGIDTLDLGCGNGIPVSQVLSGRHRVTGVDISAVQLRRARTQVAGASFVRAELTQLPFRAGSFDAIVAFYSIIHVPVEEHPRLFRELAALLRPGGFLLATLGHTAWTGTDDNWQGVADGTMYWSHAGREDYLHWLTDAGFEVEWDEFVPEGKGGHLAVFGRRRWSSRRETQLFTASLPGGATVGRVIHRMTISSVRAFAVATLIGALLLSAVGGSSADARPNSPCSSLNPCPFTYNYQGYEYYLNDYDGDAAYNWLYESWGPWGNGDSVPFYSDNYIAIGDGTSTYGSCSVADYYGPDFENDWGTVFSMNQCPTISQTQNNPYYSEYWFGYLFGNQDLMSCVSDSDYCASSGLFGFGAGWCEAVWDGTSEGSVIIWQYPSDGAGVNPPGDCES